MPDDMKTGGRVGSFLTYIADLMLLNIAIIISSVPLITMGAAITAAYKVAYDITNHTCSGVFASYFSAFRANFGKATRIWVTSLAVFAAILGYYVLVFDGGAAPGQTLWLVTAIIVLLALMGLLCYVFPLLARYENSIVQHLRNSCILSVSFFPRTLVMLLLSATPMALLILFSPIFFYTLPFWLLIGLALILQLDTFILKPVYRMLDVVSSE